MGVWLFSVQHRFEDSLQARQVQWTPPGASLHGGYWLRLPRVPNYRLQACHEAAPAFTSVTLLTLRDALRTPCYALWDEALGRMGRFPDRSEAPSS